MSGTDDNDEGPGATEESVKPAPEPAPDPTPPTDAALAEQDVDEMWGTAPPPPLGEPPEPPKPPEPGSAPQRGPSRRNEELEPMPDYSAEADRWREELHSAVEGTAPKPERKRSAGVSREHLAPPKPTRRLSPRATKIAIGGGIGVVLIGILIALGWFNARDYYLVCATDEIRAERGRGFPPWGTTTMSGDAWKAIDIPDNTECIEYRTDDVAELEGYFLEALLGQANARLASAEPENIDVAEEQLKQAFLLTRTPERRDERKEVERLVGDVEYWRAAAQVKAAVSELRKAGEQFEGAAKRLPRHQTDSTAWADYTRHMSEELLRGPPSLRPEDSTASQPGDTPPFKGTGPDSPVRMLDAGVPAEPPVDAQPGTMLPPVTDAAPAPPDAGLPRGGVLL